MKTGTLAKILGWIGGISYAFGLIPQILAQTGTHGLPAILQAVGALLAAAGIHAASNSGPTQ